MKLVLVESPTKARKLTGYLGSEFVVRASVGHIRDLPKSKMGVDLEHDFIPEYGIPRDKAKVVKELKTLAERANEIILATDPDREGEAIGWHLQEVLKETKKGAPPKKFVRATFHEITKSAILDAIAHPTTLNMDLVNAQQARRVLDRLVGYSVSPVLWKKIRYGLSAGRVQSVALRLIVEREREIEAFVPVEYWELDVLLNTDPTKPVSQPPSAETGSYFVNHTVDPLPPSMLVARVMELDGKKFEPTKTTDVEPLQQTLPTAHYIIEHIEQKQRSRVSLPPFTTSTLQQQAATRFGYTSKNTMRLAQQLYEEGLITYHRTDSLNLSQQAIQAVRGYIGSTFGPKFLPAQPRYFTTKSKNAQEAHEAIRPTTSEQHVDQVRAAHGHLTEQHLKVYDLIWRRFVASQMSAAEYDSTTVMILAKNAGKSGSSESWQQARLKTTGSVLRFAGWMQLFPNQGDVILPDITANQDLGYIELNSAQKFTQPPARYNDASLIKTLESEGIGRPSTYASIISVIEDRGYVERKEKKFFPTAIGKAVNDFLVQYFTTIVDYKFTANMEDDLDAVSRGEKEWQKIVASFYAPLAKIVDTVVEKAERAQIPVEKTGVICPKCGETEHGEIVIRTGKYGKFKSCSRYPECDFTENIVNLVDGVKCPLCQEGKVVIKPTRYGRDFYSCTRYPECDWASWSKPAVGYTLTAAEWKVQQAERAARRAAREAKYGKPEDKKKSGFKAKTSATKKLSNSRIKTTKSKVKKK